MACPGQLRHTPHMVRGPIWSSTEGSSERVRMAHAGTCRSPLTRAVPETRERLQEASKMRPRGSQDIPWSPEGSPKGLPRGSQETNIYPVSIFARASLIFRLIRTFSYYY